MADTNEKKFDDINKRLNAIESDLESIKGRAKLNDEWNKSKWANFYDGIKYAMWILALITAVLALLKD